MVTVALIGPDGAGKTTITRSLQDELMPARVRVVYMGVNLTTSTMMLPTTRLALEIKRRLGRSSDMTAAVAEPRAAETTVGRMARSGRRTVWIVVWLLEEWFRAAVAAGYCRRGDIVVFDRHFLADYYHSDIADHAGRTLSQHLHGLILQRLYPRPDLVICLDAPGEVLYERKGEGSIEWLELRRGQYREFAAMAPYGRVVDATQPVECVRREVADAIRSAHRACAA